MSMYIDDTKKQVSQCRKSCLRFLNPQRKGSCYRLKLHCLTWKTENHACNHDKWYSLQKKKKFQWYITKLNLVSVTSCVSLRLLKLSSAGNCPFRHKWNHDYTVYTRINKQKQILLQLSTDASSIHRPVTHLHRASSLSYQIGASR